MVVLTELVDGNSRSGGGQYPGGNYGRKRSYVPTGYKYTAGNDFVLLQTFQEITDYYHQVAREEIEESLGTDTSTYQVVVDGKRGAPIEDARLRGSGIIASRIGGTDELKDAVMAAIAHLRSAIGIFKKPTGYYQTSGKTSSFFTILVNGTEVADVGSINWDRVTPYSNIQIYSKARYASPLESFFRGRLLLGAQKAALAAGKGLVNASFTYRSPSKMGQVAQYSSVKSGSRPFTPLAVPVLEIGTISSNVTNYVGNIEFNLEKGRKRQRANMIERKILKHDRWLGKRTPRRP